MEECRVTRADKILKLCITCFWIGVQSGEHGGERGVYGRNAPYSVETTTWTTPTCETAVVVRPRFAQVGRVRKALEIIQRSPESFKLRLTLEDWVDEAIGSMRSLDVLKVARAPEVWQPKNP